MNMTSIPRLFRFGKNGWTAPARSIPCLLLGLLISSRGVAAPNGAVGDTNIRYFGRWDFSSSTQSVSYWGGAYFKVKFTGTTATLKVGSNTQYYAQIDGGPWTTRVPTSGVINLTPTPLAGGTHSLTVAQGKDYSYVFNFQGLVLDAGAVTLAPAVSPRLIEFIGDSITAGYTDAQANVSDYGWVCAEAMGFEHTQIAYPGIKLASGYTGVGMDQQYFKERSLAYATSADWDFTRYMPSIVVINLGQNDGSAVPDSVFQSDYVTFLGAIRGKFPDAQIYVMRAFLGTKQTPTQAAVNARIAAGDNKLHYVNTSGWLTSSDYNDGVHPSVAGHIKAANLLQPILSGAPVPAYFETENLTVQSTTAGVTHRTLEDPGFSQGLGTILDSTAPGQQVTYVLPGVASGAYSVKIGVKNFGTRGIWQLSASPAGNPAASSNVGTPQDSYASAPDFRELSLGTWTPGTTSDKWFKFTVTGKNGSSAGYTISFDSISLIPQ